MDRISLKIKKSIYDTIKKEDDELRLIHNKGIFFIPELALSYLIGKDLAKNSKEIFGSNITIWYPERKISINGPSDLYIELETNKKYIFEFKTRQKSECYLADIIKLNKLDSTFEKYFCAFIDCFEKKAPNDERILFVENRLGNIITRVSEDNSFDYFKTVDQVYANKVVCIVGLWKVK